MYNITCAQKNAWILNFFENMENADRLMAVTGSRKPKKLFMKENLKFFVEN
jgi:hypothetical protein